MDFRGGSPGVGRRTSFIDESGRTVAITEPTPRTRLSVRMAAPFIAAGDQVTLSYTPGATPLRDATGNEVQSFGPEPVMNTSGPPGLWFADVDGEVLFLRFDQFLIYDPVPDPSDFTVMVDGSRRTVSSVRIPWYRAVYATALLSSPVAAGEEVTIAYTKGDNPMQHEYGAEVENFGPLPVTNLAGRPGFRWADVDGSVMRLSFAPRPDFDAVPAAADFAVTVDGLPRAVTQVDIIVRSTYTLTRHVQLVLAPPVAAGEYVTVAYTPGATPLRHESGLTALGFDPMPVENVAARDDDPVGWPERGSDSAAVTFTGSIAELRRAALQACGLGVTLTETVDGRSVAYVPALHQRIANHAFEQAFANGLENTALLVTECRNPQA